METAKTRYQCRHIFTADRTFVEILLQDWRAGKPTNVPPESATIPDIQAVAEPQIRVPHPFRSLTANRVGYRLRKQTTVLPNSTTNSVVLPLSLSRSAFSSLFPAPLTPTQSSPAACS